jgi:hypothetical protein
MALKPPAAKKPATPPTEADIERVIAGGNATRGDQAQAAPVTPPAPGKEVQFTMAIPPGLASLIDQHRAPTKTSRRAWLLQAAEEKLKREGLI